MTSIGYTATDIIDGIPYGTQAELAVASGSPRLFAAASAARRASYALAYSGFIANEVAGGGANLGSAPRPPRYGPHAPPKSGMLLFDCAYTKVETNAADKTANKTTRKRPLSHLIIDLALQQPVGPVRDQDHSPKPAHQVGSPERAGRQVCRPLAG